MCVGGRLNDGVLRIGGQALPSIRLGCCAPELAMLSRPEGVIVCWGTLYVQNYPSTEVHPCLVCPHDFLEKSKDRCICSVHLLILSLHPTLHSSARLVPRSNEFIFLPVADLHTVRVASQPPPCPQTVSARNRRPDAVTQSTSPPLQ